MEIFKNVLGSISYINVDKEDIINCHRLGNYNEKSRQLSTKQKICIEINTSLFEHLK